jgi:NADPH:quinone reductase-like Zn-dependent oxidoreductase
MAGEVIAVGQDVKQWKTGDRVCANIFLEKLNDVQTPETDESALGGAAHGVLTEYRTFPAHVCFRLLMLFSLLNQASPQSLVAIPPHLSYEEASTLPCVLLQASCNNLNSSFRCAALAAYNALLCGYAPLKAGDTVLIQGTGGVSMYVSRILRLQQF